MNKTIARYFVLNLGLFALLLLVILSIAGAFLGAQRASLFFNSLPLAAVWIALTVLFITAFFFWKSLTSHLYLFLCHFGFIAVLVGGLWGSPTAHRLRSTIGMEQKLIKGTLMLQAGQTSNQVAAETYGIETTFELPFTVRMVQTGVTHYDEASIGFYDRSHRLIGRIPAAVGEVYVLMPDSEIAVQLTRRFEHLRLVREEDGSLAGTEDDADKANPGWEVVYRLPGGEVYRQYVFELFEPHFVGSFPFVARHLPPFIPKEYFSTLVIEKDGQPLKEKTIRVNDPLHYGGYHFYQSTFGRNQGVPYSGIMVVSDSGVGVVFFGYALISVGLFGQFWVKPVLYRRRRQEAAHAD